MKLLSLFLCNPALLTDECNAHENILCFHPPEVPLDNQMNDAGFCVALMRLQERFGVPSPWEASSSPAVDATDASSDEHLRRRVRTVTLSKRRFTIIPLEEQILLCIVTNRETLRPNVSAIVHTAPAAAGRHESTVEPQSNVRESQQHRRRSMPKNEPLGRVPSMVGSRAPHLVGDAAPSSPFWDIPNTIGHVSDDVDEGVIESLTRLGETSHRMFSMMFGSVQWNYERVCAIEVGEQRGVLKRPSRREPDSGEVEPPPTNRTGGLTRRDYEDERREQRKALERVLREGFINRLVSAISAASSAEHSLEGSFTCPEGVEISPLNAEVHLMIGSLVTQLASAHPGAIRDTFVASGMKTAHSTLSVGDTSTLFYLMKYYNSAPPLPSPGLSAESQRSDGSRGQSKTRRQQLRRSLALDVAREVEDETLDSSVDASWYDPELNLRSEVRRSGFLRTMQDRADEEDEDDRVIRALSSSQVPSGTSSLHVADRVEFGFPFIFLGDNDPVGVYTKDIGVLRFMFLVNEKYLRITELRTAFEQSMTHFLACSPIPGDLLRAIRRYAAARTGEGSLSGKPPLSKRASPGPSPNSSKSNRSSTFGGSDATSSPNARAQTKVMESHYLYYYRSAAISQVRSSILKRIPSVRGSLVCPVLLSGQARDALASVSAVPPDKRRSMLLRQLISFTGGAHSSEEDDDQPTPSSNDLTLEQRECVHLLDNVRSDVLRSTKNGASCSTLMLVRKKVWVSVLSFAARDLSCVVMDKSSVEEADAEVEMLSRLVFYFSHRPPGL